MKHVQLLIPAAGMGTRLGAGRPKALIELDGVPLLVRTLERFGSVDLVRDAVIVTPPGFRADFEKLLGAAFPGCPFHYADGGAERQNSVENGLSILQPDTEIVAIHDAARPFISEDSIRESVIAAREFGAATVAIPSIDTILVGDPDAFLVETPDRRCLWACQTPQTFQVAVIRDAHSRARQEDHLGTDDATLVQRMGGRVKLVMGSPLNFKVTTPGDFALARCVIQGGLV
ncbi:MAG: 2-C-methyl-D-erythritol 4-phosphate cytidylyltransferase [Candidatus Hydrogenedentes bacterium]|nr:2-C-methyl-D-erythritol 4-phosphate cytidylyltransferase [Candidatus Hydrogenedentota bacterium]